jgi:RNA polymerase sigma-B factor
MWPGRGNAGSPAHAGTDPERRKALRERRAEPVAVRASARAVASPELESDAQVPARAARRAAGVAPRPRDRARERAAFRAYAAHRDRETRERLIRAYLPLAHSVARRFDRGGRVPLDDLKQIAALGLMKALDRYDPDRGAAFSSFAVPTMEGEIRRYFRDATWTVRPPRELQERALRMERERERLTNDLGRSPTAGELAERIDCTVEEIIDATEAAQARGSESFDRPGLAPDDGGTLEDHLGTEDAGFAAAEASATLDILLRSISARERLALELRFREDLTQTEIGRRIGCSQMQVSRILRTALRELAEQAARSSPRAAA